MNLATGLNKDQPARIVAPPAGIVLVGPASGEGEAVYVSDNIVELFGYQPSECLAEPSWWLERVHPEDKEIARLARRELLESGKVQQEYRFRRKDGVYEWVHDESTLVRDSQGQAAEFISHWTVISGQKKDDPAAEAQQNEAFARIHRALRASNRVNRAMIRSVTEEALLVELCKTLVDVGGYSLAWVGFAGRDEQKTISVAAMYGEKMPDPKEMKVTWADQPEGEGPAGRAVRQGRTQILQARKPRQGGSPCCHQAWEEGFQACLAIPLFEGSQVIGALSIYSSREEVFEEKEEIRLLERLAGDVSYGISTLRAKAALDAARKALQANERKYKAIFEQTGDATFVTSLQGDILEVNQAYADMLGYSLERFLQINVKEHYWDLEDRKRFTQAIAETGSVKSMEVKLRHRDGHPVHCLNTAIEWKDSQGRHIGYLGTLKDITELKKSQDALKESEALLRETQAIAKLGGWEIDPLNLKATWTEEVARIHELDPETQINIESELGFYKGESREKIERALNDASDKGKPYDLELELTTAKGNHRWVRNIGHPIMQDGKAVKIRGSLQDITEIKNAQYALAQSEKKFRYLFDSTLDALFIRPLMGNYIEVNAAACRMLGYTRDELLSMSSYDVISPESLSLFPQRIERLNELGYNVYESENIAKDGRVIPVEVMSANINFQGEPAVLSSVRDISKRKRAEAEKKRMESQLRQSQKMEALGVLAGGIAHDFNNILAGIFGYAELARQKAVDEKIQRCLDQILKAGKRARDLARQILAFSRASDEDFQAINLLPIVKETTKLLDASSPDRIRISLDYDKSENLVNADPSQIHQVMMNLITNALHAISDKQGEIMISLREQQIPDPVQAAQLLLKPGLYNVISVKDTGGGIPEEILKQIFDPYFTTKETGEGTGLGLAVVHGIVTKHKGAVIVESREGEGSEFKVYLPVIGGKEDLPEQEVREDVSGGEKIVFIENEPAILESLGVGLKNLGYVVNSFNNPEKAVEFCLANPEECDVVITDFSMPGASGFEVAQRILPGRPHLPMILLSGHLTPTQKEQAREMGFAGVLDKPIETRDLAAQVRRIIDGKSLSQARALSR